MTRDSRATVGDYVTLVRGTTYKGRLVGEPGPALLGLGSLEPGGGFRTGRYKTYGGECPPELMLFPGDIYASLKGATKDGKMIGSVARVPATVSSGRLTQDTVKLVLRSSSTEDGTYLYWVLRTPQYRDYCEGRAMGSAVVALSRNDFLSYPVPAPTAERQVLVALLEATEEKIELNRRMSATLESMARALFKSWFVDFDPVRAKSEGRDPGLPKPVADLFPDRFVNSRLGDLPMGWTVGRLGEVAGNPRRPVQPSDLDPTTPYVALEHMPRRRIALTEWGVADGLGSNKFRFKKGEILFVKLRPYFHKVGIAPIDGICSTDIVVVAPQEAHWFGWILGVISSDRFVDYTNAGATGTKMPRTNWTDMARYELPKPPGPVAAALTDLIRPQVERIMACTKEGRVLAELRDVLLPELIAGDLRRGMAGVPEGPTP